GFAHIEGILCPQHHARHAPRDAWAAGVILRLALLRPNGATRRRGRRRTPPDEERLDPLVLYALPLRRHLPRPREPRREGRSGHAAVARRLRRPRREGYTRATGRRRRARADAAGGRA